MRLHHLLATTLLWSAFGAFAIPHNSSQHHHSTKANLNIDLDDVMFQPIHWLLNKFFMRSSHKKSEKARPTTPWHILNLPSYANWTGDSWNIHVHGNVYKATNLTAKRVNTLVDRLLIRAGTLKKNETRRGWEKHSNMTVTGEGREGYHRLNLTEADIARHSARGIAVTVMKDQSITAKVMDNNLSQSFNLRDRTNKHGDFDGWLDFLPHSSSSLNLFHQPTTLIQTLNLTVQPADPRGTSADRSELSVTTSFVPPHGLTIVSDVDDVLRVAEVWNWKQALLSLFAQPFKPWRNMPDIFRAWADGIPNTHFHYTSDALEPNSPFYIHGISRHYPQGTFDSRPMAFSKSSEYLHPRYTVTKQLIETFPERKFILVGDTGSATVMSAFPKLMHEFPAQVQCILIRDTEMTEKADYTFASTHSFLKLPEHKYYFFRTPSDLHNISLTHLAHLSMPSVFGLPTTPDATNASHARPFNSADAASYVQHHTTGCYPSPNDTDWTADFRQPANTRKIKNDHLTGLRSLLRGVWWRLKCDFLHRFVPLSEHCPFDWRQGLPIPGTNKTWVS